jgi:hypothetical protein
MNQFTNMDLLKVHGLCYESLMADEENQIRGFVHIGIGSGVGLSILTLFTIKEAIRIAKNAERNLPMRHKEINGADVNPALKFAIDWGLTLVTEKLRKRIKLCTDIKDMDIDKKILPKEYGGVMPMREMIELFKNELAVHRDRLVMGNLLLSFLIFGYFNIFFILDDEMTVNLDMYSEDAREGAVSALKTPLNSCSGDKDSGTFGVAGSFRKLEVD